MAVQPTICDIELIHDMAWRQFHLLNAWDVPRIHNEPTTIGVSLDSFDNTA